MGSFLSENIFANGTGNPTFLRSIISFGKYSLNIDFKGNFNHAIIIRSFLSQNNILNYQAGAGIVIDSQPEKELQEVYNKLGALDKALKNAELIK